MDAFDFIAVRLCCLRCGKFTEANQTHLQTALAAEPNARDLKPGDTLGVLSPEELEEVGYWTVHVPAEGEVVRVLEAWDCRQDCDSRLNWAEVLIDRGVLVQVNVVPLDAKTLARVHYLSNEAVANAGALLNVPVGKLLRDEALRRLIVAASRV